MTTLSPPLAPVAQMNERTYTEPADQKNRIMGVSLLIVEIGVMVGYGLSGVFRNQSIYGLNFLQTETIGIILMFIFACVGFGMLLNVYRFGNWLGSATAIIVLAVSIQLAPLLQKLWISIIITGFGSRNQSFTSATTVTDFFTNVASNKIDVGVILMRTVLLSVISIMTVMTAVVGRVSAVQVIKFTSMFQIFWCGNYFLLIYFDAVYQDHRGGVLSPYFFDMFGTTYVYLFAVFFGIPFSCLITKQSLPEVHPRNQFNRLSLLLSQIGTGMLAGLFVFTSCFVVRYQYYGSALGDNFARFAIMFGIAGSIIGTFIGSALVGGGRIGYKQVLTGSISGGIVMGAVAPIIYNIGIILMIGSVTGFLCGIYMRLAHIKINKNNVKDVLGLFGPFAISSILGSLVVAPSVISVYYNKGVNFPLTIESVPKDLAGYQLIYVGLSAGIGLVGGLLTVLLSICDKQYFALASNSRMFLNEFGLYDLGQAAKSLQALPTRSRLTPVPLPTQANYVIGQSQQGLNKSGVLI